MWVRMWVRMWVGMRGSDVARDMAAKLDGLLVSQWKITGKSISCNRQVWLSVKYGYQSRSFLSVSLLVFVPRNA